MKCPYCGSENIEEGIVMGWTSGTTGTIRQIGLLYSKSIFDVAETLYADLCKDCGSTTRIYIKGKTDRTWKKDGEPKDE